jgi:hypothetical protein
MGFSVSPTSMELLPTVVGDVPISAFIEDVIINNGYCKKKFLPFSVTDLPLKFLLD